jgi:hypothetical protein
VSKNFRSYKPLPEFLVYVPVQGKEPTGHFGKRKKKKAAPVGNPFSEMPYIFIFFT